MAIDQEMIVHASYLHKIVVFSLGNWTKNLASSIQQCLTQNNKRWKTKWCENTSNSPKKKASSNWIQISSGVSCLALLIHHSPMLQSSASYTLFHTKRNLISYHFVCSSSVEYFHHSHCSSCVKQSSLRCVGLKNVPKMKSKRRSVLVYFGKRRSVFVIRIKKRFERTRNTHTHISLASLIVIFPLDYRNQDEINNENTFEMRWKKGPNGSVWYAARTTTTCFTPEHTKTISVWFICHILCSFYLLRKSVYTVYIYFFVFVFRFFGVCVVKFEAKMASKEENDERWRKQTKKKQKEPNSAIAENVEKSAFYVYSHWT